MLTAHFSTGAILIRGFPHSSVGGESAYNAGDQDSISGLGRSPGRLQSMGSQELDTT